MNLKSKVAIQGMQRQLQDKPSNMDPLTTQHNMIGLLGQWSAFQFMISNIVTCRRQQRVGRASWPLK